MVVSKLFLEKKGVAQKLRVVAAIYARYSSDMQSPESANDQIARAQYILRKGMVNLIKYPLSQYQLAIDDNWVLKDEAETGKVADRLGYERLLSGIRDQKFDVVFVDDLSRLTRSLGDQMHLYELLKFKGIELYSICEGVSSEAPNAKTFFQIKGLVNELGNDINAQRTKRGQEARVLKGFSSGDTCFGYYSEPTQTRMSGGKEVPSHYQIYIDIEEAKVVNLIFDLKIKGLGKAAIANELNRRKIPSTKRGQKITGKQYNWSQSTIGKILEREKYIGLWAWGKSTRIKNPDTNKIVKKDIDRAKWVEHLEGSEIREDLVIVPKEKWDKVQQLLAASKKKYRKSKEKIEAVRELKQIATKSKTLLAGIINCGECGSPMLQVTSGSYGCYVYHRKDKGTCGNKRMIKTHKMEKRVTDELAKILLDDRYLELAAKRLNEKVKRRLQESPQELKSIQKALIESEREIDNLIHFITSHGNTSEAIRDKLEDKEREVSYLKQRAKSLQSAKVDKLLVTPYALRDHFERLGEYFEKDPVLANAALRKLIPEGLVCSPKGETAKKNCNQNNSKWEIEGRILIAPGLGFSNLTIGGGAGS